MQHQHEYNLFDSIRRNLANKLDRQEAFDTFATTGDLRYTKIKISETEREAREELAKRAAEIEAAVRDIDIRLTRQDGKLKEYIDNVYSHVKTQDETITDYIDGVYSHVKTQDENITKYIYDVYEHVRAQDIDIVSTINQLADRLDGEITNLKATDANIQQTTQADITALQKKDITIDNRLSELNTTDKGIKDDITALQQKDAEHTEQLSTISATLNEVKNKQEEQLKLYSSSIAETTTADITTDLNINGTITSDNVKADNETRIQNLENFMKNIYNSIYPVGAIYVSMKSTNPETLFPGTEWKKITNKFLYCTSGTSGIEGGSKQISVEQLPPHSHEITHLCVRGDENGENKYTIATYGGNDTTITTTETGEGKDYMPPYITVYAWERTR